jgi:hypothetical protein
MTEIPQPRAADEDTDDPRRPAPFLPDEADAPKDPDTGEIQIDEPDPGDEEPTPSE